MLEDLLTAYSISERVISKLIPISSASVFIASRVCKEIAKSAPSQCLVHRWGLAFLRKSPHARLAI